jgi:TRAP-type mannitol/chloroaromatic compound transport system permease small subunit
MLDHGVPSVSLSYYTAEHSFSNWGKTLVHSRLKARPQFVLDAIGKALGLFLFGFMTWQTFGNTIHSYVTGEATWGQVSIPIWIGKAFICLGSLMLTLHLLGSLILDVWGKRKIPIPASHGKPIAE